MGNFHTLAISLFKRKSPKVGEGKLKSFRRKLQYSSGRDEDEKDALQ